MKIQSPGLGPIASFLASITLLSAGCAHAPSSESKTAPPVSESAAPADQASTETATREPAFAEADTTYYGLDPLLIDSNARPSKGSLAVPEELAADFTVEEPGEDQDREPASLANDRNAKRKNSKSAANARNGSRTAANANGAKRAQAGRKKSRFPSSVSDGFELRMRYGEQVSTFWVVKRGDRQELLFANNSGSRTTLGLSPENFSFLHTAAEGLQSKSANLASCRNAAVQVNIVSGGATRTVAGCLNNKDRSSQKLVELSSVLSNFVR